MAELLSQCCLTYMKVIRYKTQGREGEKRRGNREVLGGGAERWGENY